MNAPSAPPSPAALNTQLLRLTALLQLEERGRAADRRQLAYLMVNEVAGVVAFQQAALWRSDGEGALAAVSGVPEPEGGAPYTLWLTGTCRALAAAPDAATLREVSAADLPAPLAAAWAEWFPPSALWCPLAIVGRGLSGGVLLGRAEPFGPGEKQLLALAYGALAESLALRTLAGTKPLLPRWRPRRATLVAAGAVAIVLLALLPVRVSVLAPAEIVPIDPAPIRSPFDGVVASIAVPPNVPVKAGQTLLTLDTTELTAKVAVADKALDIARAEYAKASQEALGFDLKAKGKLAVLESKVQQQEAELAYDRNLLGRAAVAAPIDGVAVYDDPVAWIGKPVALGERIMLVADPAQAQLEVQVPVGDVVTFAPGAEVQFFGNIAPDRPVRAALVFASYGSTATPDGVVAYNFRARFDAPDPTLRLGLKGTAKVYGERRPLVLWLLRKPIAVVRQWVAL